MPAVVTLVPIGIATTSDGLTFAEALRKLEELGADVVGLNCLRGPETTLPLMPDIRKACKVDLNVEFQKYLY